jgi:hypothetical protein
MSTRGKLPIVLSIVSTYYICILYPVPSRPSADYQAAGSCQLGESCREADFLTRSLSRLAFTVLGYGKV